MIDYNLNTNPSLKRKIETEEEPNKHFKPENIFLFLPEEIFIKIGEYLSDRSKLNINLSSKAILGYGPGFWNYFEQGRPFRLIDFKNFSFKIRYFAERKFLNFMTSAREAPDIDHSQREYKRWCRSLDKEGFSPDIMQAHEQLTSIFLWSINTRTLGIGDCPKLLTEMASRVHKEESSLSENLVAGWIAAHKTQEIAKEYVLKAFGAETPQSDKIAPGGIVEAACIPCLFPQVFKKDTRDLLVKKAASNGSFLPLELIFGYTYSKEVYRSFAQLAPAAAWKAINRLKENKPSTALFDFALESYKKYASNTDGPYGPVRIKVLKNAVKAYASEDQPEKAITLYEAVIRSCFEKNKPVPRLALFHASWAYMHVMDYQKGIKLANQWLLTSENENDDRHAHIYYLLSFAYYKLHNFEEAVQYGEKSLQYTSLDSVLGNKRCVILGDAYANLKRPLSALDYYLKVSSSELMPGVLVGIAICYKQLGEADSSIDYFERAIKEFKAAQMEVPAIVFLDLALALQTKGENQRAIEFYIQGLARGTPSLEHLLSLSRANAAMSDTNNAIRSYSAALAQLKSSSIPYPVLQEVNLFIDSQDFSLLPVDCLNSLGSVCQSLNDAGKLERILLELLKKIAPESHPIHFARASEMLCNIYFYQNNYELAKRYFEFSLLVSKGESSDPLYYEFALKMYLALGIYDNALKFYDLAMAKAESLNMTFPVSFFLKAAEANFHLGFKEDRIVVLQFALDQCKRNHQTPPPDLYAALASAYFEVGDDEKFVENLNQVSLKAPITSVAMLERAASYCYKTGKTSLSLHFYCRALVEHKKNNSPIPSNIKQEIQELQTQIEPSSLPDSDLENLAFILKLLENLEAALYLLEQITQRQRLHPNVYDTILARILSICVELNDKERIRKISEELSQRTQAANIELYIACSNANLALENYPEAAKFAEEGLAQAKDNTREKLDLLVFSGHAYFALGDNPKAAERYNYARIAFRCLRDPLLVKIAKLNIGLGHFNEAIACLKDICRNSLQTKLPPPAEVLDELDAITSQYKNFTEKALSYLSFNYFVLKQYKKSIHFAKLCIKEAKSPLYISSALQTLEDSYTEIGKIEKFFRYLQKCKIAASSSNSPLVEVFGQAEASARKKLLIC